jgi:hypothetical protein
MPGPPDSSNSACTLTLLDNISTAAKFSNWSQGYTSSLNILAGLTTIPSTTQQTTLIQSTTDIMNMNMCLQEKVRKNYGLANSIHSSQDQIQELNKQIEQEEANASVSKDRVAYMRNPERDVSNYESWFPIDRPMHTFSLVIIISISLFISIFALLMLVSFMGINLSLFIDPAISVTRSSWTYWLYTQVTPVTWAILIVLIAVVIYFMKRN